MIKIQKYRIKTNSVKVLTRTIITPNTIYLDTPLFADISSKTEFQTRATVCLQKRERKPGSDIEDE